MGKAEKILFEGALAESAPEIDRALALGADIDCEDQESGMTPLMVAAMEGCARGVALLLDRGADPSMSVRESDYLHLNGYYTGLDHTAIWFAIHSGQKECATLLIHANGLPSPMAIEACAKSASKEMAAWFRDYVAFGWEKEVLEKELSHGANGAAERAKAMRL